MATKDLHEHAVAYGVEPRYRDNRKQWRETPESTLREVVDRLADSAARHAGHPVPLALRPGEALPFEGPAELETEDGEGLTVEGALPPDLPFGYHTLHRSSDEPRMLITAPASCYLPEPLRTWGWAVQLYSVRSRTSWGMGDLSDLAKLAEWSAGQSCDVLMVNPIGAVNPFHPIQASPYSPSSRTFRNPLYLSIGALEGGEDPEIRPLRDSARALGSSRLIDRDAVWDLKMQALSFLWDRFRPAPAFDRYCEQHGASLDAFATFSAISEEQGRPWDRWAESLASPTGSGIASFQREHRERIKFHKWVQWLIDQQLGRAGAKIGIINDLPVSVDPSGSETWAWSRAFASGLSIGAPPDDFNTNGQSWGICPYDPEGLKACNYEPFIQTIRSGFAHARGLRIDHVMGLFRLFWVPYGSDPSEGVYVRYPARELLDIVAIESQRAQAFVVGEDLGTVEPWMSDRLGKRSILSYRLLLFEPDPGKIPRRALAAVTTHDLPTIAGIWTGADLQAQVKIGLKPFKSTVELMRRSITSAANAGPKASTEDVITRVYAKLAECPASVVAAMLEDALGVQERPNMPGTVDDWPNWRLSLPLGLEKIMISDRVGKVSEVMRSARGGEEGSVSEPPD